ncbi:MAG: hypothetical protein IT306_06185 [Chloroflexi bacterium]|nr:hypothetical protein [Chloroflexota bacterium]
MTDDEPSPTTADDEAQAAVTLEGALADSEAAADRALTAAAQLTRALRQLRGAAQHGHLRNLRSSLGAVAQAADAARAAALDAAASWTLDDEAYLADGSFTREVLESARAAGLQLFERDERMYCYPVLVRVAAAERSVFVDRARERRIRPSVLVRLLRDIQQRPPRFRPDAFMESLFTAYSFLVQRRGPDALAAGHPERLAEVYALMTLAPGAARDYSTQEFARDIYLLDRGGVTTTRRGYVVSFPASTGARSSGPALRVVTESGQEKVYYSIAFSPGA